MSEREIIIKTPEQIEGIRKACKVTAQLLDYLRPQIVAGISTGEINRLVEQFTAEKGGIPATLNYRGFPKSCCTSINEVICHGIPADDVILKDGDIINVDVSTILDGYFGDTSAMFAIGTVSKQALQLMDVAKKCLEIGIKEVRPGNYFGNIGFAITKYALQHGCSVVYTFAGHGVGIKFHEGPDVNHYMTRKNQGPIMVPNMTFTIEPMINAGTPHLRIDADNWTARTGDGKLSAQYEHTVLVTEKSVEILTLP